MNVWAGVGILANWTNEEVAALVELPLGILGELMTAIN